mgnify:FL=1
MTFARLKRLFLRLNSTGTVYGAGRLNLIPVNATLAAAEDSTNEEIDVTITAGIHTIEAHTAADTLTAAESGSLHTNGGASGSVAITLPPAAANLRYSFLVMAAQSLVITAGAGDTIRLGAGAAGNAAGTLTADAVGESVDLIAINATEWHTVPGTAAVGTWTAG